MLRRHLARSRATLLLDFTPPRVWMEALEARTLLSVDLTPDTELREGYFRFLGAGSVTEKYGPSSVWGNARGFSGAIASFWGDVPSVNRTYVRLQPSDAGEHAWADNWIPASILDVPGPTWEVHASISALFGFTDQPMVAEIAMVNDLSGDTYYFGHTYVFFSDRSMLTTPKTEFKGWVQRDMHRVQLGADDFFDRQDKFNAQYTVEVDWGDGSPVESHAAESGHSGYVYLDLDHPMHEGMTPRITVWNSDRSDSISGTVELEFPDLSAPPPPSQAEYQEQWAVQRGWTIRAAKFAAGERVNSVGELWTLNELPAGQEIPVTWDYDRDTKQTETAHLTPIGLKTNPDTGRVWHAYTIDIAPRAMKPGWYYPTIEVDTGDDFVETEQTGVWVSPSTLSYIYGLIGEPQIVPTVTLQEGTTENWDWMYFTDVGTRSIDDYRAWFTFADGTQAPAIIGETYPREEFTSFIIRPDFTLWSSDGVPLNAHEMKPEYYYTSAYEDFATTLHIEREGAVLDLPTTIRLGGGEWIGPNNSSPPDGLYLPRAIEPHLSPTAFRDRTVNLEIPVDVIDPNLLSQATVEIDWGNSTETKRITQRPDGTYLVIAAHTYASSGRYSVGVRVRLGEREISNSTTTVFVGDGQGMYLTVPPWDFRELASDVDWGREGLGVVGGEIFIFDDIATVPTATAVIDDGSPVRVTLVPVRSESWNVPVYRVVLQAYFASAGTRKLVLDVAHAKMQKRENLRIEVHRGAEEAFTQLEDGSRVPTNEYDYIELTDKTPLVPLWSDQLDAVRYSDIGFSALSTGRVNLRIPVVVNKHDVLAEVQTQIIWGDGATEFANIQPDASGGHFILASHYYAGGGRHLVEVKSTINGVPIEAAHRNITSSPKEGYLWRGDPDYTEIPSGVDFGAADLAFDLPLLQVFETNINIDDVKVSVVFDDGSPVNVYKEFYREYGEYFIYTNLEVYFTEPGARAYTMTIEWNGKRADLRGVVDAKPYSEEAADEAGGAYIWTPIGELIVNGWHGVSGHWYDTPRPLKPGAPVPEPIEPEEPYVDVVNDGESDWADEIALGISAGDEDVSYSSSDWGTSFFEDERDPEWLGVIG